MLLGYARATQLGQIEKNAKKGFKKFVKLLDHTCVCNDFTNFECEGQASGNGSYVNLHKLVQWKTRENHFG